MDITKEHVYAALIAAKVLELFDSEKGGSIPDEDFETNENVSHFIHALANLVPSYIYAEITGDAKNLIEFNHLANKLVFQYSKLIEKPMVKAEDESEDQDVKEG